MLVAAEHSPVAREVTRTVTTPMAASLADPRPLAPSDPVLHSKQYRVTGLLGEGGMGRVYRAWDPVLERDVALKVLKPDVPGRARERFRREAVFGARLCHPNLVRIFDLGTLADRGLDWFAMEFLHGKDLEALLDRARRKRLRLSPKLVASLFDRLLDALQHAHEHGVVHRDVKPANVFITRFGSPARVGVKLLDFGVAFELGAAGVPEVCGDPRYIAPEQALGSADLDTRADIYAAGITLFEALVGTHPFEDLLDAEPEALVGAHCEREIPRASDHLPRAISRETRCSLDVVLATACAKQPADRFASAAEMRRALLEAVG